MPISEIDAVAINNTCEMDVSKYPAFLGQLFSLSALLICCSKNKQIPHGVGVELEAELGINSTLGELNTLVAFPYVRIGQRQNDSCGNFYYSVISLITKDEAKMIKHDQKHLLSLFLKRKGYDQVISVRRRSIGCNTVSNLSEVEKKPQTLADYL